MAELEATVNELIQSKMTIAQLNVSVDDLRLQNSKLMQQQSPMSFTTPRRMKKGSFLASFSNVDSERGDEIMCMNCTNCSILEDGGDLNSYSAYGASKQFLSSGNNSDSINLEN